MRSQRASEIGAGLSSWLTKGNGAALLTLTIRHSRSDDLGDLRRGLTRAFSRLQASRQWRRLRDDHGLRGMIRALDLTWGAANGWHPHLHVVLVLDTQPNPAALELLREDLGKQWRTVVARHLGTRFVPRADGVGIDLRPIRGPDDLAGYLVKVAAAYGAASETARADTKTAKGERLTPFGIAAAAAAGDARARSLFREFAGAVLGVPVVSWSRGLRDLLGSPEVDDETALEQAETAADTLDDLVEVVPLVGIDLAHPPPAGLVVQVLDLAETSGAEALRRWLDLRRGVPPPGPPPPHPPPLSAPEPEPVLF